MQRRRGPRAAKIRIPLTYMVFDVLSVEGESVTSLPYSHRRALLEDLGLDARGWRTPQTFEDGEALWEAVCVHELEGVVAKPRRSRYLPGERDWVKTKNRAYWRYEMEREGALRFDASGSSSNGSGTGRRRCRRH
jgi:bifunctional non-homologous end joining protein LigD